MHTEAYFARPLSGGAVQRQVCEHHCAVRPGEAGKCGVRRNVVCHLFIGTGGA